MAELRRYRSFITDSTRWSEFSFRPGDIVISTPPKCGTTWMQTLCAMLVFGTVDLPARLSSLSPWFDMRLHATQDVMARLEAQQHRRFIKTHTPLDGIPYDERVTYVCVGRDPRDAGWSAAFHMQNTNVETVLTTRAAAVGLDDLAEFGPPPPDLSADPAAYFRYWVVEEDNPYLISTLSTVLHQFDTFWARRGLANVALFHYAELSADLPGQVRRLGEVLDIPVDGDSVAAYAEAAGFDRMKSQADRLVPNAEEAIWHSSDAFFRRGGSGDWRSMLTAEDLEVYDRRVHELTSAEVADWAHQVAGAAAGASHAIRSVPTP